MSGKKAQTVGYYYFLGIQFLLCHGPVDRIYKLVADKKVAWDGETDSWTTGDKIIFALNLFGGPEKEGGIGGPFELNTGGPSQGQSPYLVSKLIGQLVPAFRGICSIVARQIYVGTTTYLKNMGWGAVRIHKRTSQGIAQWYDAKAEIGGAAFTSGVTKLYEVDLIGTAQQYGSSAMCVIAGLMYVFRNTHSLYDTNGIIQVYSYALDTAVETFLGSFTPTNFGTCYDGWSDVPVYVCSNNSQVISIQEYSLTTGLVTSRTVNMTGTPSASDGLFSEGSQTANYHRRGSEQYIISENFTDNDSYIYDVTGATPILIIHSVSSDSDGIIHDIFVGATFNYAVTLTERLICFNKSWVKQWSVNYSSTIIISAPVSGIGGADVLIREESSGQVIIHSNNGWVRINSVGFTELGVVPPPFIIGGVYEEHGGNHLIGNIWYKYSALANNVGAAQLYSYGSSGDMNPAHIIRECLTDPDWGMGYQDADIDDTAFTAAADTLYAEGLGISILWNKQTQIQDFIVEITKHIDASLYLDIHTGKFVLKLIRNDYSLGSLITLDPSNIEKLDNYTRPTIGELTNSVTVKYWDGETDTEAAVTVQDIALAQIQGSEINATLQYPGFTNASVASRIAQRDLRTLSTPIISCTLYCNRAAADLNIGHAFKLTWPDYVINQLVMRVTGIAFGDGKRNQCRVTCTQDVYSMPATAMITPEPPAWVDPSTEPVAVVNQLAYEVPYLEAVQQQGQTSVDAQLATTPELSFVGIAGRKPSVGSISAQLYTDSGAGYQDQGAVDFSPAAEMSAAVSKTATSFNVENLSDIDLAANGSWLQCGTEIMVKVSYVAPLLTVKRGALDTVPITHADGAQIFFWDAFFAADGTEYMDGETVNIKLLTNTGVGTLELGSAPASSITVDGRMARPYPPAQFQINGAYYPDNAAGLLISWVHRDRLTQTGGTYLGTLDAGVGPEAGTTYNIRIYKVSDDSLLHNATGITGTSYDATASVSYNGSIRIELESQRDGLVSYQKHSHVLTRVADGVMAWTEANDTMAAAASVKVNCALSWTEANDLFAISAAIAWTEADDITAMTGTVT